MNNPALLIVQLHHGHTLFMWGKDKKKAKQDDATVCRDRVKTDSNPAYTEYKLTG